MDQYDISATATYILDHGFTRVALQFPDDLLAISVDVTSLLRLALSRRDINLYVMADTTYGSCCVDEVAAAHVDAQCVIHYGHACLSQTSRLPVFFVFGRQQIDAHHCSQEILSFASPQKQPLVVLFALDYAHAIQEIKGDVEACSNASVVIFAEVPERAMDPLRSGTPERVVSSCIGSSGCSTCSGAVQIPAIAPESNQEKQETERQESESIGGIKWSLPKGVMMEDVAIFWIGDEGAALTNLLLTYNKNTIVR